MDTNENEKVVTEEANEEVVKPAETTTEQPLGNEPIIENEQTQKKVDENIEPTKEEVPSTNQEESNPTTTNIFGLPEEEPQQEKEPEPKIEEVNHPNEEEVTVEEPEIHLEKNGEEKVVFEYKKQKEMGLLPLIIFFAFIGLIIAFLPTIQKYIKDYQNGKITITGSSKEETTELKQPDETPQEEIEYYKFNNDTTVSINRLTLTNFDKKTEGINYFITLNVTNKDNKDYSFDENIYIELYNVNKTLLSRSLIETDDVLNAASSIDISLPINEKAFSEVSLMIVKEIDKNTYPSITITENLKDQQELTCTLKNRTTLYTFKDYKLLSIDDQLIKQRTDYLDMEAYQADYLEFKQLANTNNTISGLSASVLDDNNQFSYAVKIDLSHITEADLNSLKTRNYYSKNTEAKTIAFEMNARGYECK